MQSGMQLLGLHCALVLLFIVGHVIATGSTPNLVQGALKLQGGASGWSWAPLWPWPQRGLHPLHVLG